LLHLKKGKRGKAYSILEGMEIAKYDYLAFIDADLQYPPEVLPKMVDKLNDGLDVVATKREEDSTSRIRKFLHWGFDFFFTRALHGFKFDVQSGLKVFTREVAREVKINPTGWTFDLEFLLKARNYGYRIGSVDIKFAKRIFGESKINFIKQIWEIGFNAVKLRAKKIAPLLITPKNNDSMLGAGIAHKKQRFVTHTTLDKKISAYNTFTGLQKGFFFILLMAIGLGLIVSPMTTGIILMALLSLLYFIDVIFNLFLVIKSLKQPPELEFSNNELEAIDDSKLPIYSILCPLYKEAQILPGFLKAIKKLKWPQGRLDVLLLLEENDQETITAARELELDEHIRIIVVPHSLPKTKPKACNYGLNLAKGEYVVIYDAEDIPDPWQLKKAYLGFKQSPSSVRCLQAKLNYYNSNQNLLTRLFTAEYSLWFDIILPGLQTLNTSLHSNIYHNEILKSIRHYT